MNRTGTRLGVLALAAAAAVAFSTWTPRRIAAEEISLPGEEAPAEESWSGAGPARASQPSGRIMEGGGVLGLLWRGGGVMFFIALCSIVGVAFAIERAVALRRSVHIVEGLSDETLAVYRRDGADEAIRSLSAKPVSEARVLAAALARSGTGYREMEFAVAQAGTRLLNRMQKNVRILGILSNVAPLLGLLGTVLGMIEAFDQVADVGALGKQTELAGGIAKALLTTGFGLLVAIPSYLLYHYFKGRAEGLVREMEETAGGFALELERSEAGAADAGREDA